MKKTAIKLAFVFLMLCNFSTWGQAKKENNAMNVFIDNLMKKMTLEEKLGQLNLITPTSKTGPFATVKYAEKLTNGSAGNVYSVMGTPEYNHSKMILAENTRLKNSIAEWFRYYPRI